LGFAFTAQYDDVGPQSVVHVSEEVGINLKLRHFSIKMALATLTAQEKLSEVHFVGFDTLATSYLDHDA
jgi:hypothetical protein